MKIGITMRTSRDSATGEIRDAIDRGWWRFLSIALPEDVIVPIPNHPVTARRFFATTALEGIVLTGGDDIGASPERDATEAAILDACGEIALPVLGVCRGMQFLSHRHGASLVRSDPGLHRAVRHPLRIDPTRSPISARSLSDANSFHDMQVDLPSASPLEAWAWSDDGCIEGIASKELNLLGIGWHPEREISARPEDIAIFREHFHGGPE